MNNEIHRLATFIADGIEWLDACPFRHSEYYYETAQPTLETAIDELCEALHKANEPGVAETVEAITAELPAGMDEIAFYREIARNHA